MMYLDSEASFERFDPTASLEQLDTYFASHGRKIDLGCGFNKPEGYLGLDNLVGRDAQHVNNTNAPDLLLNINHSRFPLRDNACTEVRTSHFLEHSVVDHIVRESFRVLEPGGTFVVRVPYANSAEGMYPGHTIFFTEKWFYNNMVFNDHFRIASESFQPTQEWEEEFPDPMKEQFPFDVARKFFFNVCNEMTLLCCPKK